MNDFKREERYIVVKIKDVGATRLGALRQFLAAKEIPTRECVVVEPDWSIYEMVWHLVERLATGQRLPYMSDEHPDKIRADRDALAAHVERLTSVADKLSTVAPEYLDHLAADAHLVLRDAPTTSLARLKAQWQAEAVEMAVARGYRSRDELAGWAEHLRRQAEGHHHD